jgi:hypothetical protein
MARPRKPSDPNQWPIPCGRCGEHHQIVANWPDGGVCGYCYQQAKRTRGTCVCGHEGVLPGRIDGQPACRRCSGVKLNLDCKTCGAEDELYRGSRCWSCELAALVYQLLTNPDTGVMAAELVPVAAALKSMKRSNSGVTWIRQRHVAFLKDLAVAPSITHEKLDELPGADRTRNYVRGLLVAHGALPRRDELTVRYAQWATSALARVSDDDHRDVVRRFIRWHLQRRMNRMETVPHGTFLRSKQTVTVTIEFLNWLNDHGITLAELQSTSTPGWRMDRAPADSSIASSPGRSSAAWSTPNSASRGTAEERAPSCPSPNRTRPSSVWSTPTSSPRATGRPPSWSSSSVSTSKTSSS